MADIFFLPQILQPTRVTDHSATIIDNIFFNSLEHHSVSGNIVHDLPESVMRDALSPAFVTQKNGCTGSFSLPGFNTAILFSFHVFCLWCRAQRTKQKRDYRSLSFTSSQIKQKGKNFKKLLHVGMRLLFGISRLRTWYTVCLQILLG